MNRIVIGALAALLFVAVGLFWWQGRAAIDPGLPPPAPEDFAGPEAQPTALPSADVAGMVGPALPEATEATREQRRFGRYDRDRDGRITRNEMLSTRTAAFRKLDKDANNLLTFEEWASATAQRFDRADRDRNRELSPAEFARTKPKPVAKAKCAC
jgi:EF hand